MTKTFLLHLSRFTNTIYDQTFIWKSNHKKKIMYINVHEQKLAKKIRIRNAKFKMVKKEKYYTLQNIRIRKL